MISSVREHRLGDGGGLLAATTTACRFLGGLAFACASLGAALLGGLTLAGLAGGAACASLGTTLLTILQ
jgi:hypothetical protein